MKDSYQKEVGICVNEVLTLGELLIQVDRVLPSRKKIVQEMVARQLRRVCVSAKALAEKAIIS